jgi:hypothetical protein
MGRAETQTWGKEGAEESDGNESAKHPAVETVVVDVVVEHVPGVTVVTEIEATGDRS